MDGGGRILLTSPEGLLIGGNDGWQKIDRSVGLRGTVYSAFEDRSTPSGLAPPARGSRSGAGIGNGRAIPLRAGSPATWCTKSCPRTTGRSSWALKRVCFVERVRPSACRSRAFQGRLVLSFTAFAGRPVGTFGLELKREARPAWMREPARWSGLVRRRVLSARQLTRCASIANSGFGQLPKKGFLWPGSLPQVLANQRIAARTGVGGCRRHRRHCVGRRRWRTLRIRSRPVEALHRERRPQQH